MKVTKCQALTCPQCHSFEVSPGFDKQVKKAFVFDGNIWCYACQKVTQTITGRVSDHIYSANHVHEEEIPYEPEPDGTDYLPDQEEIEEEEEAVED